MLKLIIADPFAPNTTNVRSFLDGKVHVSNFIITEATQWLNTISEVAEGSPTELMKFFKAEKADRAHLFAEQFFEENELIDSFFSSKWSDIRSDLEDLIVSTKQSLQTALNSMYDVQSRYRDHIARSAPMPSSAPVPAQASIAAASSKVSIDWSREKVIQIDNQRTGPTAMDPHEFVNYFLSLVRPKKILEVDYTPVFTNFIHDSNTRRLFETEMFVRTSDNGQPVYATWNVCVQWINHRWLVPQDKYKPLDKLLFAAKFFIHTEHPTIEGFTAHYQQKISDCNIESLPNTPIDALLGRMYLYQLPRKLQEALVAELSKQDLQRMIDDPQSEGNLLTLERVSALANLLSRSRPEFLLFDKTIPHASVGMVQMSNTNVPPLQVDHSHKRKKGNHTPNAAEHGPNGSAPPNHRPPTYVPRKGDSCAGTMDGVGPDPEVCYWYNHPSMLASPPLPARHTPAKCHAMHPDLRTASAKPKHKTN